MIYKIPRKGTRKEALFRHLCLNPHGVAWSNAKTVYDNHYPAHSRHSRQYSGMELARLLNDFCNAVGERGKRVYKLKPEYALAVINVYDYYKPNNIPLDSLKDVVLNSHMKQTGPEPQMDDLCGRCGERYGAHYGLSWPGPSDCPVVELDGEYRRAKEDEPKRYWSWDKSPSVTVERKPAGSPEIEDMAWGSTKYCWGEDDFGIEQAMDEARIEDLERDNARLMQRLFNGKTAIDTARSMLADILVGSLNETPRAIEELDAQLSGTYGVLDGTMDE